MVKVVEGIICMYSQCVDNRRVTMVDDKSRIRKNVMVEQDIQCRGCVGTKNSMYALLESHGCLDGFGAGADRACR